MSEFSLIGLICFGSENMENPSITRNLHNGANELHIDEREISSMKNKCYNQNARLIGEERIYNESCAGVPYRTELAPHVSSITFSDDPFFFGKTFLYFFYFFKIF